MGILSGLESINKSHRGAVVTIGNFDGVHKGHQKIISAATGTAAELGVKTLAITFEPHPVKVLRADRSLRLLTPPEEKARLLLHYGIDNLLFLEFNRAFAGLSAEEFIQDILVDALRARMVIVGHNYAFGRGKRGTTGLLRRRGQRLGFGLKVVRSAMAYGKAVSSTRVRTILSYGKVAKAAELLMRPFMVEGVVVRGVGRGARLLDTPTANINPVNEMLPRNGVYAVKVGLGRKVLDGVVNIGVSPTFKGTAPSCEAHILDFRQDLLGRTLRLYFIERLRDEQTFADPDALRTQIFADITQARAILKKHVGRLI